MSSTADVQKQGSLNESWRIVVMMKHRPPYFLSFFNMIITKIAMKRIGWPSTVVAVLAVFALAGSPAVTAAFGTAQASPNDPQGQIEALGRRLGMTPAEVEALGLTPEEVTNLLDGLTVEMVVIGTRAEPRSVTESTVPVDVLSADDLTRQGTVDLQAQLRTVVPSFNVNTQPISDASTIVRPAMLRNLAPDHTLVLVNGKRRHRASIIDWHGGNGVAYGSQGADITAIPSIALRQVEVLRDGASAQYGSDAIAGVINFQLKDAASGGALEYHAGTFGHGDGKAMHVAANTGLPLGAAGFANLSLEYGGSNPTNRSAPRSDAIKLIAAGNTDVTSDTPQIWGSPDIDGDLKLFGNFGYTFSDAVQVYGHTNYASKKVTGGFFFRNPNTRGGVFTGDGGKTLLIGDVLRANGTGSADCPTVAITDNAADRASLQQVFNDPNCFSFRELFPGGFTPSFGGEAQDVSLVGGIRSFTGVGFNWDVSATIGAHETDLFIDDTVNASLGPGTPTSFNLGSNRQREIGVNFDMAYAATDRINIAAGAEWRNEQYQTTQGDPESWTVGPYGRGQGFTAGSNGFFGYGPMAAGTWNRSNVAVYGDAEATGVKDDWTWTIGSAVRIERFEDFGTTVNGKLSARVGFLRASLSSGFRAPTPGQQNGFNISTIFDPAIGDLVNNGVIPSISPVAALRGGMPLEPEKSINYTVGMVFDTGSFNFTADYFLIDVSDRIGITSNFSLMNAEVDSLLAQGVDAARDLRNFRFFTNAFSTRSSGIDLVSTFTPIGLRGNTTISAVFNYTNTDVTENEQGLLNNRRLAEYAYSLPKFRWNIALTQHIGRVSVLGRVNYHGGWYDYDSGFAQTYLPSGGIDQGFFSGRPIVDLEASIALGSATTLAVGGQNVFSTYPAESARAMSVGEKYSEYTPWGFNGGYYYVRLGYKWGS